jgi:hypothetical protein
VEGVEGHPHFSIGNENEKVKKSKSENGYIYGVFWTPPPSTPPQPSTDRRFIDPAKKKGR